MVLKMLPSIMRFGLSSIESNGGMMQKLILLARLGTCRGFGDSFSLRWVRGGACFRLLECPNLTP